MKESDLKEEIIGVLVDVLSISKQKISESTQLESIMTDSMEAIELVAVLSNKYNILVRPEMMNNIKTVGHLIKYVEQNKGTKKDKKFLQSF